MSEVSPETLAEMREVLGELGITDAATIEDSVVVNAIIAEFGSIETYMNDYDH